MDPVVTQSEFRGDGVTLVADRWDPPTQDASGSGVDRKGLVLLLHGGGQTRHSWRNTGRSLAADGWSAIALDARGHGESQWAPDGNYGIDALVADLTSIIGELGEKPVLVGASMGGMTSLIGQGENPELARGLVLVDIAPKIETAGTGEIMAFMHSGLDGFASLDDAAAAIAAYTPNRVRKPNPQGCTKTSASVMAAGTGIGIRSSFATATSPLAKPTRSCDTNARGTPQPRSPFQRCSFVASNPMWSAKKAPKNCSS